LRIKITFVIERPSDPTKLDRELGLAIKTLEEVKSIFEKNGISVLKAEIEDFPRSNN
jgi:hypothetical protein